MSQAEKSAVSVQIIDKARSLGASLAGIASVEQLKKSPSHDIYTKIEPNQGVGSRDFSEGIKPGEVAWPVPERLLAALRIHRLIWGWSPCREKTDGTTGKYVGPKSRNVLITKNSSYRTVIPNQ